MLNFVIVLIILTY